MNKYINLTIEEANKYYYESCEKGHFNDIKYLVDNYQLDLIQEEGASKKTAVEHIILNKRLDILKYLIDNKGQKQILLNTKNNDICLSFCMWFVGIAGDIEILKYILLKYENIIKTNLLVDSLNLVLNGASTSNKIEMVKYLLLSDEIKNKPKLPNFNYHAFQNATENGSLDVMDFYLTCEKLKNRPTATTYNNHGVRFAAWRGHLNIVEYLLTSDRITEHADIHAGNDSALDGAVMNEDIEMMDFLLRSKKLKDHANIHVKNDLIFRKAVTKNKLVALKYLIVDYHINITEPIEKIIKSNQKIKKMFEMRDLYKKLNKNFLDVEIKDKKQKI